MYEHVERVVKRLGDSGHASFKWTCPEVAQSLAERSPHTCSFRADVTTSATVHADHALETIDDGDGSREHRSDNRNQT